jgi:hypothetical protein
MMNKSRVGLPRRRGRGISNHSPLDDPALWQLIAPPPEPDAAAAAGGRWRALARRPKPR